jgi:hypothetical protein
MSWRRFWKAIEREKNQLMFNVGFVKISEAEGKYLFSAKF